MTDATSRRVRSAAYRVGELPQTVKVGSLTERNTRSIATIAGTGRSCHRYYDRRCPHHTQNAEALETAYALDLNDEFIPFRIGSYSGALEGDGLFVNFRSDRARQT